MSIIKKLRYYNMNMTSDSPTVHLSGTLYSAGVQTAVATPPIMHHGLITVSPPVMRVLARRAVSLNP